MNTSLFSKTPTVTILDNRGLTARDIAYHRHPDQQDVTNERIIRHQYDARGFLTQSADSRLYNAKLANFSHLNSLAGSVLKTVSADAGTSISINDAAGRPFMLINGISADQKARDDDSQAVTRTWQYENATLAGRLLSVSEQAINSGVRITERFVYAGNTDAEKAFNLAGQCVSHYDTAGLMQTDSVALTGKVLSVTRRLLKDADDPDTVVDWQGENAAAWDKLLESEQYTTITTADTTGAVLTTVDPKGNTQRMAYDVAGLLSGSWLTLNAGKEQAIITALDYCATGQKQREEHNNGVVTTYQYEPQTQRLTGIKTQRLAGHAAGAKVLQDLHYEYDAVGNVVSVSNQAETTRFWRNQKVMAQNTYRYDSLYQLVNATGREMANVGQQGHYLPSVAVPLLVDEPAYTNYARTYRYDSAGNLTQISHSAPASNNNFTLNITVSDRSNRAVLSTLTENPAEVEALFTASGQQKWLQRGQQLDWTWRNQLQTVTPITRDGSMDDREHYRYDANSQRIMKVSTQKSGNAMQTRRVVYLPQLELRTVASGATQMERLQTITAGEAGRAQVRVLHWESGKPTEISNDQWRYSYDNLIGSSSLELDGDGNVISMEEYYPYGGTAVWTARSAIEADHKILRYSGKERDSTGLYYYGYRYYQPWVGRWLSVDPAGAVDGLNLFKMCKNNPVTLMDEDGRWPKGLFDKDYVGTMELNNEKVDIRKSPWPNSYQIGKDSKLTFQLEVVNVDNKKVSFKRNTDSKAFNELYQRWKNNDVTLIRGISSSHFSWNNIVADKTVYSEGDKDLPSATMGGSKSRWLPTALEDEGNRFMVAGIAMGNHTDVIKDAMRDEQKGSNVLAGAILTFKAGKDIETNINFLYDGEIVVQGPVKYPNFKIDSLITGNMMEPIDITHIEDYDEVLPLAAPYISPGASEEDIAVANEMSHAFLRKGEEVLTKIRANRQ